MCLGPELWWSLQVVIKKKFWWWLVLNSRAHACYAGTVPLEPLEPLEPFSQPKM
jgi:hypothetical protein